MEFRWKFAGRMKLIAFGLLLSLSIMNGDKSDCNYSYNLEPGQAIYLYSSIYVNYCENRYTRQITIANPYKFKMNCSTEIPKSDNCEDDALSITEENTYKYCGFGNFVKDGQNVIIKFDSSHYPEISRFVCQIQAEKSVDKSVDKCGDCRCGWKNPSRIVGGQETGVNEYPYMAGLVDTESHEIYCGATIISHCSVLTAAHCIENRDLNTIGVIVGEHDVTTGKETNATKLFRIENCKIHPDYDTINNDIAICKIVGTIKYTLQVGPVCLPFQHRRDSFGGSIVKTMGWGLTEFGGTKATKLQKADLNVITNQCCQKDYPQRNITKYNICTLTKGRDACQMDSGGPLIWENPTTHNNVLIGIITSGSGCDYGAPGIYTHVGSYVKWIKNETSSEKDCKIECEVE